MLLLIFSKYVSQKKLSFTPPSQRRLCSCGKGSRGAGMDLILTLRSVNVSPRKTYIINSERVLLVLSEPHGAQHQRLYALNPLTEKHYMPLC